MRKLYILDMSDSVQGGVLELLGVLVLDSFESKSYFGLMFMDRKRSKSDWLYDVESRFESGETVGTAVFALGDLIRWTDISELPNFRIAKSSIVLQMSDTSLDHDSVMSEICKNISAEEVYGR